jgi:hypothetical protein
MRSKRATEVALAVLIALAGLSAAFISVAAAPAEVPTTETTGTEATMTSPLTVPDDVTIGNVPVGGMTVDAAGAALREAFSTPLPLRVAGRGVKLDPAEIGAKPEIDQALELALSSLPGEQLPLGVSINNARLRKYVGKLSKRYDAKPVDAKLYLRHLRPWISNGEHGLAIVRPKAVSSIAAALRANRRFAIVLSLKNLPRRITRDNFGPVIVIRRGSNRLYYYTGTTFRRRFGVATGQSAYPTPLGRFTIVVKWRYPWWYPPNSSWAKGASPIPPGPGNPLGTRWMGLSVSGVGIHGTPNSSSIGYSLSHGCIRMLISEAEWLFDRVKIGTTVFIVSA